MNLDIPRFDNVQDFIVVVVAFIVIGQGTLSHFGIHFVQFDQQVVRFLIQFMRVQTRASGLLST